jgi:hypothetical protein
MEILSRLAEVWSGLATRFLAVNSKTGEDKQQIGIDY